MDETAVNRAVADELRHLRETRHLPPAIDADTVGEPGSLLHFLAQCEILDVVCADTLKRALDRVESGED